jgi:hypothetical protein
VLQSIWVAGGNPKMVITNGTQKQAEARSLALLTSAARLATR